MAGLLAVLAGAADAQPVSLAAGSTTLFAPTAAHQCFAGIARREERLTTRAEGDCVFEGGGLRARLFMDSGAGVTAVDVTAEVKIIALQFQVDAPASGASHIPVHVVVPVSWEGRFVNATAPALTTSGFVSAAASVNMVLRLRQGNAADVNVPGTLLSQTRFQGASHGGISHCISIPTDHVSALETLLGCSLAVAQRDEGTALAEISAVIRTGQVYNLELVVRGDLTAPFTLNPPGALVPERINFRDGAFGMTWHQSATIRIGSDPATAADALRVELEALRALVASLRSDFDGHTHSYRTGAGDGHNAVEAQTPPPR